MSIFINGRGFAGKEAATSDEHLTPRPSKQALKETRGKERLEERDMLYMKEHPAYSVSQT
jgi:hypothetical protein